MEHLLHNDLFYIRTQPPENHDVIVLVNDIYVLGLTMTYEPNNINNLTSAFILSGHTCLNYINVLLMTKFQVSFARSTATQVVNQKKKKKCIHCGDLQMKRHIY